MKNSEIILKILQKQPQTFQELKKKLPQDLKLNNREIDAVLKQLQRENKIYFRRNQQKYYLKDEDSLIGIFKETRHSYGFVESDELSVFIPEKFTLNAINGDTVKIIFFPLDEGGDPKRRAGKIVRIVKRNGNNIILRVRSKDGNIVFLPDDLESKYEYKLINDDKYNEGVILVTRFNKMEEKTVFVTVNKVLGSEEEANLDYLLLAYKNNIPIHFSKEAIQEVDNIQKISTNLKREDYRNKLTYTIDGISSKDLDDAISIEKTSSGYILYVHIADVSHYVKSDSVLDYEALKRCNSIYLIDKVFPMLPEILSNKLCSLNPNEDRNTLTCKMVFDNDANLKSYQISNSIINSNYRLTYEEVDKFLSDSNAILRNDQSLSNNLHEALKLSKLIREQKFRVGMIDFSLPEFKIDLDENGVPTNIYNKYQTTSEKIIEDLMVITNQTVAKFLIKNHVEGIFRVHDKPKIENISNFFDLARTFVSIPINTYDKIDQHWFTKFLKEIEDTDYELILKRNMIQTMEKAMYKNSNLGHYALGLKEYLHFTSPIRRYADLIVHRNIKSYLENNNYFKINNNETQLESIALECSKKEREAMMIERKINDIKKVRYIKNNMQEEFEGQIVSFSRLGMYIELTNLIQGIVKFASIPNSEYAYVEEKFIAVDKITNKKFSLGQKVKVKIYNLDIVRGQIDFQLI